MIKSLLEVNSYKIPRYQEPIQAKVTKYQDTKNLFKLKLRNNANIMLSSYMLFCDIQQFDMTLLDILSF